MKLNWSGIRKPLNGGAANEIEAAVINGRKKANECNELIKTNIK